MSIYPTFAHTDAIVDDFAPVLEEVLAVLADAVEKDNVMSRLRGPVKGMKLGRLT
jgi:hypothetical protein